MCRSDQRRKKGFLPQRIYGSIMDTGVQGITGFLKKMFKKKLSVHTAYKAKSKLQVYSTLATML